MKAAPTVTITLTRDQALVLFEWLSREDAKNYIPIEHQAEKKVLWEVEGQLERLLVEPLQADYATAICVARKRVMLEETE